MNIVRIALVEDDERLRGLLIAHLEATPGIRCIAAYGDAESAIRDVPDKKPDIILMDINLPGISGIEAIRMMKPAMPTTDFVILTVFEDNKRIFEALEAGAVGYLLKSTSPNDLVEALHEVRRGGSPTSAPIARKIVQSFQRHPVPETALEALTEREDEVLTQLARGFTYKEISQNLFISRDTVHSHIRNIYRKLHVRSRTEAVVKFLNKQV